MIGGEYKHLALLIRDRIQKYNHKVALRYEVPGKNRWKNISWKKFGELIDLTAKALLGLDVKPFDNIGIFSANKPEWTIADFAIYSTRAVSVPVFSTDSVLRLKYIVNETGMKVIFVGHKEQYEKIIELFNDHTTLEKVVVFDQNVTLYPEIPSVYFKDFIKDDLLDEKKQKLLFERLSKLSVNDLATIIYTSGTTGEPKGVMLSHSNLIQALKIHDQRIPVCENDSSLCFLPLSHVYERTWTYIVLHKGMINNYLNNPRSVMDALQKIKPQTMCAVPRFFEKTYAFIIRYVSTKSLVWRKIFYWSLKTGKIWFTKKRTEQKRSFKLWMKFILADIMVLRRVRRFFGNRIKFIASAGACLPFEINEFFHSLGFYILVGYGLTETTATVTAYPVKDYSLDSVGTPMPETDVKIGKMSEILIRGKTVTPGYYKKPEETEMAFDNQWFKTGDKGHFNKKGELIFDGRIKEIIKTSVGKFIAPQQLENKLEFNPYIDQVIVVGDDKKFISALIVPEFDLLKAYAKKNNISYPSLDVLLTNDKIKNFFYTIISDSQKDFAAYKQIQRFALLNRPFTIESGELTNTYKLKRNVICNNYSRLIDSFYLEND
ncbi:MAG: AMP-dependent synthetase/ligase [Bacteroidota bacterium]